MPPALPGNGNSSRVIIHPVVLQFSAQQHLINHMSAVFDNEENACIALADLEDVLESPMSHKDSEVGFASAFWFGEPSTRAFVSLCLRKFNE